MKVFVTGESGQLGYDVCRVLQERRIAHKGVSSRELDITDGTAVETALRAYRPDAVIHCAAYTRVELAEEEPERCWRVNVDGTRNIAAACRALDCPLLYISTDYVFPGTGESPWEVWDGAAPQSVYGQSKLAGELAVRALVEKAFVVRTSWVFGKNGSNFVKTMLRLAAEKEEVGVVCDQIGSPTYTADLAELLCDMIVTERYGTYHAANEGYCSWADFAEAIFRAAGKDTRVKPVLSRDYPARAQRPLNSRLSHRSLGEAGFDRLPGWQDALERYLAALRE